MAQSNLKQYSCAQVVAYHRKPLCPVVDPDLPQSEILPSADESLVDADSEAAFEHAFFLLPSSLRFRKAAGAILPNGELCIRGEASAAVNPPLVLAAVTEVTRIHRRECSCAYPAPTFARYSLQWRI